MSIIFTNHSLLKMNQRGISKAMVIDTAKNPDHVYDSREDRKVAYKKLGWMYLKVIFKKERGNLLIITQYLVKEIKL